MSALEHQLNQLLESTISQHGYWLKNHREIIEEDLKSGIVSFGLKKMIERLDDYQSPYVKNLYKKIKEANQ